MREKTYIAIDLKSFYASVECIERGLDPLLVNLVVADSARTEKTICLAVSPTLKTLGLSGRARLFEVVEKVKAANEQRRLKSPNQALTGKSYFIDELNNNPSLAIDYVVATPRMGLYSKYSNKIYSIYLNYLSDVDILNYSIDEVIMDATTYLGASKLSAKEFATNIARDVYRQTGITATVGIGTNMYLAKVAMDIVAKHIAPDKDGVRVALLNETTYRHRLWNHRPLTDFWRVGRGISKRLETYGIYTMGDIAKCSVGKPNTFYNEGLLYELFGVNAELLIDHAWGYEPCTIADAKSYVPKNNSLCSGQVLLCPYDNYKARIIVMEMIDLVALDLVEKGLKTNQITLTVGYDIENLLDDKKKEKYNGEVVTDGYGRKVPKPAHGTVNTPFYTSSSKVLTKSILRLFDEIVDDKLLVRKINISVNRLLEDRVANQTVQMSFFDETTEDNKVDKEKDVQKAVIGIKKKYGKNSILKGMNFQEGATTRDRNGQMGGHKA